MKRHIQDFNRFSVNEMSSINEAAGQGPFVCGIAWVDGDYGLSDSIWIHSTFEGAKASLGEMLMEMEEDGQRFDQGIAFLAEQEMDQRLMRIDSEGGGYGEILLTGTGKKIFVEDLEQGIGAVIKKLELL